MQSIRPLAGLCTTLTVICRCLGTQVMFNAHRKLGPALVAIKTTHEVTSVSQLIIRILIRPREMGIISGVISDLRL